MLWFMHDTMLFRSVPDVWLNVGVVIGVIVGLWLAIAYLFQAWQGRISRKGVRGWLVSTLDLASDALFGVAFWLGSMYMCGAVFAMIIYVAWPWSLLVIGVLIWLIAVGYYFHIRDPRTIR